MVQILREQTRQYAADKSSAIRTEQIAQNIGEWQDTISGAAKVYDAVKKDFIDTPRKEAEEADKNIIATQYGKTAHNETIGQLDTLADKYGADSERFKEEAYALADKNYAPQIEGMTSEKYKLEMQSKLRDTKDYIDTYKNTQRAKSIQERKAQISAERLVKDFGKEAYEQGARQEYSDINGVDDYVKYVTKKTGAPEEVVRAGVEREIGTSRMLGVIDNDIVTAASALDDEEVLKDYFTNVVNNDPQYDRYSDSEKQKVIQGLIDDETRKETSDENLRSALGEDYLSALEDYYTKDLNEEKVRLKRELSLVNSKSQRASDLKKKIDKIDSQLAEVDEREILDLARKEMKGGYNGNPGLGSVLKQRYAEFKQEMKVDRYNNSVYTLTDAMNPNPLIAQQAQWKIWAAENNLIDKNSTELGEWENKSSSKYNPLMSPIKDEVNVDELASDYRQYIKNSETVKTQLHTTYEGTLAMSDALQDLLNRPDLTPIQAVALGYKAINTMEEAPITEDQRQTFRNLVVRAIQDRGFGDMAKSVLENSNRYYPDTNWMENTFPNLLGNAADRLTFELSGVHLPSHEVSGMPEGGVRRTDISNVKKMMDARTQEAINTALHQMVNVAYLPKEQQMAAFQQISDDLVTAKKDIFDEAMMNYGIDLKYLDNELNTKGRAYARIGFVVKEYKGRDSEGLPLFEDYMSPDQAAAGKKILDLLLGLGNEGE